MYHRSYQWTWKEKVESEREPDHPLKTDQDPAKRNEAGAEIDITADTDTDQLRNLRMRRTANEDENVDENDVVAKKKAVVTTLTKLSVMLKQTALMKIDHDPLHLPKPNARAIEAAETETNTVNEIRPAIGTISLPHISTAPAIDHTVTIDRAAVIGTGTESTDIATVAEALKNPKLSPKR